MNEALDKWYLKGSVLHPTQQFLRQHVTALSNFHDSATLQFHFSDNRTITFAHAHLSPSPWNHLRIFRHITLDDSSEGFDVLRQFIYCTPVDLVDIPCALVKAAWAWQVYDLYNACFLVAETAYLTIIELVEKYIPLIQTTNVPKRFKYYLAGRIAIDAVGLRQWIQDSPNENKRISKQKRLSHALEKGGITEPTRRALRLYSHLHETDMLPRDSCSHSSSTNGKQTLALTWRVPMAELLASGQEYVETELCTQGLAASMEVTWNAHGAGLVVGLQRVDACGAMDISGAVIGLPCVCADQKHNTGWVLEGGAEGRNLDWVLSHEVGFALFDDTGLREWRNVHKNCRLLIKVVVAVVDSDVDTDADGDLASGSDADRDVELKEDVMTNEDMNGG